MKIFEFTPKEKAHTDFLKKQLSGFIFHRKEGENIQIKGGTKRYTEMIEKYVEPFIQEGAGIKIIEE